MSTIIKLRCIDQVLTFDSTPIIASGGQQEDFVQVEFCPKWDGLVKSAVFWRDGVATIPVMLDENDSCAIPPEVMFDDGRIHLGFFGVGADGKQRTSLVLSYVIHAGAITSESVPRNPTADLYTQVLAKYAEVHAAALQAIEEARGVVAEAARTADAAEQSAQYATQAADEAAQAADEAAQAAEEAAKASQFASGSYVGTGTYGEAKPSTLTFDFPPKAILFYGAVRSSRYGKSVYPMVMICGAGEYSLCTDGLNRYHLGNVTVNGNTASWYTTNLEKAYDSETEAHTDVTIIPYGQMNGAGKTYHYVAIG